MIKSVGLLAACVGNGTLSKAFSVHAEALLSTLVVAEHKGGELAASTLNVISAAASVTPDAITALVSGSQVSGVSQQIAKIKGVSKVLQADHQCLDHALSEPQAALLAALQRRNLLPRAAALLDVQPVSDVTNILSSDTFERPIYAGNAIATIKATDALRMFTVRTTSFPAAETSTNSVEQIEKLDVEELLKGADLLENKISEWVGEEVRESERPELGSAKVVICGGRALKNAENFKHVERLADLMGAAVGASRAAVDAGWVPNDLQVGQTGKVVAPDLYIALGISGAIQHLAGMKDSKTIVAINTDAEAPIFEVADYGLVQDIFTALPELEEAISKLRASQG